MRSYVEVQLQGEPRGGRAQMEYISLKAHAAENLRGLQEHVQLRHAKLTIFLLSHIGPRSQVVHVLLTIEIGNAHIGVICSRTPAAQF